MPVRVGINGFGRIGRNVFRAAMAKNADVEGVASTDLAAPKPRAQRLKSDPTRGPYRGPGGAAGAPIGVAGEPLKVLAERDPAALPWGDLGVDVVIESTGFFTDRENAAK